MNAKEIIKAINKFIKDSDEGIYAFSEMESLNKDNLSGEEAEVELFKSVGPYKQVEHTKERAGYEEPDNVRYVYYFMDHDVYLCLEGTYSSWVGSEFAKPLYEVFPETVSVIKYRKTKPKVKS